MNHSMITYKFSSFYFVNVSVINNFHITAFTIGGISLPNLLSVSTVKIEDFD